jgi:hypothetical protein
MMNQTRGAGSMMRHSTRNRILDISVSLCCTLVFNSPTLLMLTSVARCLHPLRFYVFGQTVCLMQRCHVQGNFHDVLIVRGVHYTKK